MKKITVFLCGIFLLITIGCGKKSENHKHKGLIINFDNCTIGKNEFSFGRLERGFFPDGHFDIETKKPTQAFENYLERLSDQIFYATGEKGAGEWLDKNGEPALSLSVINFKPAYPVLSVRVGRIKTIPFLSPKATPKQFEVIFSNEIVHKQELNNGEILKYNLTFCGKYSAVALVPTNSMPAEHRGDYYPIRIDISLKKKAKMETTEKRKQKTYVTFFQIQDYKASHGGDQSYTVSCSDGSSGVVSETDVGKGYGSICASGGPCGISVCKPKDNWSKSLAAQKVCESCD